MLPHTFSLTLPVTLPVDGLPQIPGLSAAGNLPTAAWALLGVALAVVALVTVKRLRRLVLLATVAVVGVVVAWNTGLLTSVS